MLRVLWRWKPTAPRRPLDEPAHRRGVATPIVSASTSSAAPSSRAASSATAPGSTWPSNGQPNAHETVTVAGTSAEPRGSPRPASTASSSVAFPLRSVEALRRGERAVDPVEPGSARSARSRARSGRARELDAAAPRRSPPRPPPRPPSAARGRRARSDTASIRGSPAAARRATSSARVAGASASGSFWSPSRGPTSQIVTSIRRSFSRCARGAAPTVTACIRPRPSARPSACASTTTPAPSRASPPRSARPAAARRDRHRARRDARRRFATSPSLADDEPHLDAIVAAVQRVDGVEVLHVSDRTFLLHLGGKIEVVPRAPLKTRDDLSMVYTPGVARVSRAIADDPEKVWNLTIKRNTVAVVTDGTAVLGLGDIGPEAALPVMEGKAMLFKEFGDVDAVPDLPRRRRTSTRSSRTVKAIAPGFGGINLEDISAPRCFEIERRLRRGLDIPVFHDDQHGTAIVVLAALLNALRVVDKTHRGRRGSSRPAAARPASAVTQDPARTRARARSSAATRAARSTAAGTDLNDAKREYAEMTNPRRRAAAPRTSCSRAPTSSSASPSRARSPSRASRGWRRGAIVFAMANPDPEVDPEEIEAHRRGDRDRPLRLPEPDQQRARLPRRLPRRARRAGAHDQRRRWSSPPRTRSRRRSPTTSSPPTTSSRASSTATSLPRSPRRSRGGRSRAASPAEPPLPAASRAFRSSPRNSAAPMHSGHARHHAVHGRSVTPRRRAPPGRLRGRAPSPTR